MRILITGGAGFVGSHLADELLAQGHRVRVLDNLSPQVHEQRRWPDYLAPEVERVRGDVRDADALARALKGCEAVFHLAARVGVGQSMYRIADYTDVNDRGTAVLMEALIQHPVERLVVASSMSIYGEGLYADAGGRELRQSAPGNGTRGDGKARAGRGREAALEAVALKDPDRAGGNGHESPGRHHHHNGEGESGDGSSHGCEAVTMHEHIRRCASRMKAGRWEPVGPAGEKLTPLPTPETKPPNLASVYALSKYQQEQMALIVGRAYAIPTVALRFFNVYGPRQALSNPYTGVMAIFASRLLNDKAAMIFEDGGQQRDFVSVHDVARACRLALERDEAVGGVFNVGSGRQVTVGGLADALGQVMNKGGIPPRITGDYRVGDIRHCFADISRIRRVLGFRPRISLTDGLAELAQWLEGRVAADRVDQAHDELTARGLAG